jgi:hypothetical protein
MDQRPYFKLEVDPPIKGSNIAPPADAEAAEDESCDAAASTLTVFTLDLAPLGRGMLEPMAAAIFAAALVA